MKTWGIPWRQVPLHEILTYYDERVELDDMTEYITITVKRRHGGLVERQRLLGSQIRTKKQFKLMPEAFIISRVQCWHQAYALVPDDVPPNMIASTNYDQFIIAPTVDARFFWWLSHSPLFTETVRSSAFGVVIEKMVFKRDLWLEKTIPLPPLEEQQRIVARIEELAALTEEARGLRAKAREEAEALPFEVLHDFISKGIVKGWALRPLSEVCEVNPSRKGRMNYPDDMQVSFVPMSAVDKATGSIAWPEVRSFSEVKRGYKWFLEGDVIFARITPCMQNGKSAIAKGLVNDVGFGSTEFHVIKPGEKVTAEWVHRIVRQPSFRHDAKATFKGSAGQQRVPRTFLEAYEVPVPSIDEQRRIVAYLDNLQAQVDELAALQEATQAELDALLPSVLDRAFRGEL